MNQTLSALLKLLAEGDVCSGERLGKEVGISRAAVWKHLRQLQSLGLPLETVRGSGYRLGRPLQLLDKNYISENMAPEFDLKVLVENSIPSTNQFLYDAFSQDTQCSATVIFAEHQTQGRGRRGRRWHSPYGSNLYFSLAWRYFQGVSGLEGVSLAIGVGICRALEKLNIPSVGLKWPNDVLHNDKKLAGILVEVGGDASGDCFIVIGIGLNVNMPPSGEIDQPWTDLNAITGVEDWDRNVLAVSLLNEVLPILQGYSEAGFVRYQADWQNYDAFRGREVKVLAGNQEIIGRCLGVSDSGSLRLDVKGEEHLLMGGELSLRIV